MFVPIVIVGISMAATVAILFLLRTNAAVVFLGLCAGNLLVNQLGYDAASAAHIVTRSTLVTNNTIQIALLVAPAVLSALFLRKSLKGSGAVINIVPAVAVAGLGALLVVPLLPNAAQQAITTSSQWSTLLQYQSIVLIIGITASMVVLLLTAKQPGHRKRK